jgi:hypothetical protein
MAEKNIYDKYYENVDELNKKLSEIENAAYYARMQTAAWGSSDEHLKVTKQQIEDIKKWVNELDGLVRQSDIAFNVWYNTPEE